MKHSTTDQSSLLQELRVTLAKTELALGAIKDAVVWTTEDGRIEWCNAAFDQLIEQSHPVILGNQIVTLLPLTQKGERVPPERYPAQLALQGQGEVSDVYEYQKQNRSIFLEIVGKRIEVNQSEKNVVLSIRDITAHKISEEKDRRFADHALAAAEKERKRALELDLAYKQLKEAQEMLIQSEKLAAVGQLASGVAHEVKNPLGIILQSVNFLELELGRDQKPLAEILATIKEAVKRADQIISGLLNFSRPAPLELKAVPLEKIVDGSLHLVGKRLNLSGVQVKKEIPKTLPPVLADVNKMQQVFINLFLNALQAMPQGGSLTIRSFTQVLDKPGQGVGSRADDKFPVGQTVLICEVEDTGMGVAADKLSKVFDPFFTTKPPGEGTGLGLSVSRSIVASHGGLIRIESEADRGTRIILTLPIAR